MLKVEILDLGINNVKSLSSALKEASSLELKIIKNGQESANPDLLILPGVGSFGTAMTALYKRDFSKLINSHYEKGGLLFGVCLGMQLLGSVSEESNNVQGLGLIPGKVKRLVSTEDTRVPNVGWSDVRTNEFTPERFQEFNSKDFYFVHSYYFSPKEPTDTLFTANHGKIEFAAGIQRDNVLGVQFHPEKSSKNGIEFLKLVLGWVSAET
jgi:glutamine amidotransferase